MKRCFRRIFSLGSGTPREPLIKLRVGPHRQEIWFLVDSGAERTMVQQLL